MSLGGHVVVPKTEKENLDVVAIAEQYYKVWNQILVYQLTLIVKQICEAKQNSGKTIWIGINSEVNMNEWQISGGGRGQKGSTRQERWLQVETWRGRGWATQTGRMRVPMATVLTSSQRWGKVWVITIVFSAQTGVGNKGKWGDAICSINSVLNLCTICQFDEAVVEYFILGMCQASVNQYAMYIFWQHFRQTPWTVSTPLSMAWGSRTGLRDRSWRVGWTPTSSSTSPARCGRWGTCTAQTMPYSPIRGQKGEASTQLEGGEFLLFSTWQWFAGTSGWCSILSATLSTRRYPWH